MSHSPLNDLVSAVAELTEHTHDSIANGQARPDLNREGRTGVPEVIYASGKDVEQLRALSSVFVERTGRVILSRIARADAQTLIAEFPECAPRHSPRAQMLVLRKTDVGPPAGGQVGIITAGTSDLPVAEQAQIIAEEMGCQVSLIGDVGVAGLHRLFAPLHTLLESNVDVIIVAAGMDGALPSVVSGLVDVPVIGLPTSTGYGVGGQGIAALLSMLQTCAPGLSVVNVDNGVGAGITAALIANRVARARKV
ncbi:MAG TPA: nickel pincer cofactor biosynthesis protein LarB [Chloroflexota bacterium]|nr:nickel pincer cofactor biosynthesis protein LarB [Chloroflexota bacterium]